MVWESIVFFFCINPIVCGLFAGYLADKKGYSFWTWFTAGFFFSIIGLITAAGLPIKENTAPIDSFNNKECPDCREMIKVKASICRYCGNKFTQKEIDEILSEKAKEKVVIFQINSGEGKEDFYPVRIFEETEEEFYIKFKEKKFSIHKYDLEKEKLTQGFRYFGYNSSTSLLKKLGSNPYKTLNDALNEAEKTVVDLIKELK
jgi:hypothetical protein